MDFDFCSYDFNPFLRRKITNPQSNGTEQFFYAVGNKVFVDAITQTEAFDADLKIEIATQTDQPLDYVCKLCRGKSPNQNEVPLICDLDHLDQSNSIKNPSEKNLNQRQISDTILLPNSHLKRYQRGWSHNRHEPFFFFEFLNGFGRMLWFSLTRFFGYFGRGPRA